MTDALYPPFGPDTLATYEAVVQYGVWYGGSPDTIDGATTDDVVEIARHALAEIRRLTGEYEL